MEDIPDGGGRLFSYGVGKSAFRLLILRSGGQCHGYVNRCPHFGVPLAELDEHLITVPHRMVKCNVHYSHFRWQDGLCEEGECVGESLETVPLTLEGSALRMGATARP
jgi:nitrite reductase/ring-hydroxylating ferredoxin subunit